MKKKSQPGIFNNEQLGEEGGSEECCMGERVENEDESGESESEEEDNVEDYKKLPTTEVVIRIKNKYSDEEELFRVLLDSGTIRCFGTEEAIQ